MHIEFYIFVTGWENFKGGIGEVLQGKQGVSSYVVAKNLFTAAQAGHLTVFQARGQCQVPRKHFVRNL